MFKKIIMLTICLAIIYTIVFIIPNHVQLLALIPEKIYAGEIWRFLTFQFTHLSELHLFENLAGLLLVGFLATELKMKFGDFSFVYFFSGTLSIVPLFLIINFIALGASGAIYGAMGLILIGAAQFVKMRYTLPALAVIIFAQSILSLSCGLGCGQFLSDLRQAASHFSGFVFGLTLFSLLNKTEVLLGRKKKYVLRGV